MEYLHTDSFWKTESSDPYSKFFFQIIYLLNSRQQKYLIEKKGVRIDILSYF